MSKDIEKISEWLGTGSLNIFGSPFSGKDTQGRRLAELLNAPLIGGGDILRNHPDQETIKRLMSTGELFPTDFYLSVVLPYFSKPEFVGRPLILSSVGRWHGEELNVMKAAKESSHQLRAAIYLKISEEEIWKRFKKAVEQKDRGDRVDDDRNALKVRIQEFLNKTLPVIEFYKNEKLLVEIEGSNTPDQVTQEIITKLQGFAQNTTPR